MRRSNRSTRVRTPLVLSLLLGLLLILTQAACKKPTAPAKERALDKQVSAVPVSMADADALTSATPPNKPPEASTSAQTPPGQPGDKGTVEPTNPFETAKQASAAARDAAKKRQLDKAVDFYLAALELAPQSARIRVELASLLIKRKDSPSARQFSQQAVELKPNWSQAWNTMGRVELLDGHLERAATAFSEAAKLNPKNIFAHNNLGLVRIKQRKYEAAAKALKLATAGQGATPYMFNNLGLALERLDEVDDALTAYKEGLARGSGVAGQNFVRLEKTLDMEETAQRPKAKPQTPSES